MDILCERCKTEYEFDDAQITEQGVTVKCSTCGHVFKVRKAAVITTEPAVPAGAAGGGAAAAARNRDWMIRKEDGRVLAFRELTTLQKWIVERRVTRNDQISRSGDTWKRLGDIPELAAFFSVVGSDSAVDGDDAPTLHERVREGARAPDEASTRLASKPILRSEATMELSDGDVEGLEGPTRPDERPLPAEAFRPEGRAGAVPTLRGHSGGSAAVGLAAAPAGMAVRPSHGGAPMALQPTMMQPPAPSGPRVQPAPSAAVVAAAAAHRKTTGPRPAAGLGAGAGAAGSGPSAGPSVTGTNPGMGPAGAGVGAGGASSAAGGTRATGGHAASGKAGAAASKARGGSGEHELGDFGVVGDGHAEPSFDMPAGPAPSDRRRSGPTATVSGGGPASYTARFRGEPSGEYDAPERSARGGGKLMGLVLGALALTALAAGGFYLFSVRPPWFANLLGGLGGIVDAEDTAALLKLVERGKALAALDTDSDLEDAIEVFEKAKPQGEEAPPFAPALGAAAETHAIWAGHLLDDAALLRRLAKDAAKRDSAITAAPAAAAPDEKGKKGKKGAAPATVAATAAGPALTPTPTPTIDPSIADGLEKAGKAKLDKAADLAAEALEVDPKQPDALRATALVHLLSGDLDKMKDALDVVLEGAPEEPGALAIMGLSYLGDVDQTEKAEKMLRKALAGNKDLLRAHYYLARLYTDAGRPEDARKEVRKLLDMNASHERASRLLDALDGDLEGFAAAVRAGKGSGKAGTEPTTAAPATSAPVASGEPGTAAVDTFAATGAGTAPGTAGDGVGTKPGTGGGDVGPAGSAEATIARAAKLLEDGNTKAAEKLFKKAIETAPNNLEALTGLAYCYLDLGSVSSAAAMFKRALAVDPNHGESIIGFARALSASGDFAGAAREYNHYLELYPSGPLARGAKFQLEKLAPKLAPKALPVDPGPAATAAPDPPEKTAPPESSPGG